jgi:hypothetical protein
MNKQRRKEIHKANTLIQQALEKAGLVRDMIDDARKTLEPDGVVSMTSDMLLLMGDATVFADQAHDILESCRDDEQEYYDNMPESIQGGEKGCNAEQDVATMEEVISALEAFRDEVGSEGGDVEEIVSAIDALEADAGDGVDLAG